jgi:hypothetical protein
MGRVAGMTIGRELKGKQHPAGGTGGGKPDAPRPRSAQLTSMPAMSPASRQSASSWRKAFQPWP